MAKSPSQKSSALGDLIKSIGNPLARIADQQLATEPKGFTDSGCFALNALLTGSIFRGPGYGQFYGFAGQSQTGKSLFACMEARNAQLADPENTYVILIDAEAAHTQASIAAWSPRPDRVLHLPLATVEEFRRQASAVADWFIAQNETRAKDKLPPFKTFSILDSQGLLTCEAELTNVAKAGEEQNQGMGILPRILKASYRSLVMKMAELNTGPFIVLAHTTPKLSGPGADEISGGRALLYSCWSILTLSSAQEKDKTGARTGSWLTAKVYKSRYIKPGLSASILVDYEKGLDRYSGLCDWAIEAGIFKKQGSYVVLPNGEALYESQLKPEHWTPEILNTIDEWVGVNFRYGKGAGVSQAEGPLDPDLDESVVAEDIKIMAAIKPSKADAVAGDNLAAQFAAERAGAPNKQASTDVEEVAKEVAKARGKRVPSIADREQAQKIVDAQLTAQADANKVDPNAVAEIQKIIDDQVAQA